jgi:hypothetical protein
MSWLATIVAISVGCDAFQKKKNAQKHKSTPAPRPPDEGPQLLDEFISEALRKIIVKVQIGTSKCVT